MALVKNPDIPKEIISIINHIKFANMTEQQITAGLDTLEKHAIGILPKKAFVPDGRKVPYKVVEGIPQFVFDRLNPFDYTKAKAEDLEKLKENLPLIHEFLSAYGVPMRPFNPAY